MRLIDADILLKRIEQSKLSNPHTDIAFKRAHEAEHCHFLHMVIDMPTVEPKQGEWIPCSERLPDDLTSVLVWTKGWDIGIAFFNRLDEDEWDFMKTSPAEGEVLAWMPLPTAYKGVNDETD